MSDEIKVRNLVDIVSYQNEAVVSKTIIKKTAGTVTAFAFDKGQELSTHSAPFDALVQIIEGKVDVTISSDVYTLTKGDVVIMPANEPHSLKAVDKFQMLLTMIKSN